MRFAHGNSAVQPAMISYRTGRPVKWDLAGERIAGNPAAANLLKRPYRAPYVHPYAGA
jgi:hypothetical protein